MTYEEAELKADMLDHGNPAFLGWCLIALLPVLFITAIKLGMWVAA
jgi:hypothetical protein